MITHAVFLLPRPEATSTELDAAMEKARALKDKIPAEQNCGGYLSI